MLVYVDQTDNTKSHYYSSIEEKDIIMGIFRDKAKQEMRDNDYTEFRYAVIDFYKDQSTVFIMTRKVAETFEITGC